MLIPLLSTAMAQTACEAPQDPAVLLEVAQAAGAALDALDEAAMDAAQATLDDAVPCLDRVVLPSEAAAAFRSRAIFAFARADLEGAQHAFAQVKRIDPGWSVDGLPSRESLREVWARAIPGDVVERRIPVDVSGTVFVNGAVTTRVPKGAAYVLQVVSEEGRVETRIVGRDDPLPTLPRREATAGRPSPVASGPAQPMRFAVGVSMGALTWPDSRLRGGQVLGFVEPSLRLSLGSRVDLLARVAIGAGPADGDQWSILPVYRVGATWAPSDQTPAWVGASVLVMHHGSALRFTEGATLDLGYRPTLDTGTHLDVVGSVGYTGALFASLSVGASFGAR